ncbi:MAG: SAM-dependent methyltransferase, partial [Rhodospirillaceae bacterium]|nr:SAM-dependent methyltransferase [Rhodospirillaceae bacterium]
VPFEVIPGITAAAGAAASIGVPLTHRGMATGVRFVTGHCRSDVPLDMDWKSLADPNTTLVVYMGLANMGQISANLMAAGLSGETPVMAVSKATTTEQQTCKATLATLVDTVNSKKLKSPVLIIIGQVAGLADIIGPEMMANRGSDDNKKIRSIANA